MHQLTLSVTALILALAPQVVHSHLALWHPSMYGFNVTQETFPYENRPVTPLMHNTFKEWWFHNHIDYPPHDGDVFHFPAGGKATAEIACHKGATSYWRSSEGRTDIRQPDGFPCPGPGNGFKANTASIHTTGFNDVTGCAIAIVDKDDVHSIKPEDFAIFTTNRHCPWTTTTEFEVPAAMPKCTGKYCHCAWFWIHSINSGSEQMYMNGFRCDVTGTTSIAKKITKPKLARRGPPGSANCTVGAVQPLYWFQKEMNNMFEGEYDPPLYNEKYCFRDGAQNNIFTDEQGPYEGSSPTGQGQSSGGSGSNINGGSTAKTDGATNGSSGTSQSQQGSSEYVQGPVTKKQKCLNAKRAAKRKRSNVLRKTRSGIRNLFR